MAEHPWIKSYPAQSRWDIDIPIGPVHEILDRTAAKWPANLATDFLDKKTSYRELLDLANRAARGFQDLGVGPGVRVALFLPNTPHFVIAFFGVLKAGGTVVTISPLDAERELAHKIEDSGAEIVVTLDLAALYPRVAAMLGRGKLRALVVGSLAEVLPFPKNLLFPLVKRREIARVPRDARHAPFAGLLANDGVWQPHPIDDPEDALALLIYSGGTTGLPKGTMTTHANLSAACNQFWGMVGDESGLLREGEERILAVLPLFHSYALSVNLLFGIRSAAALILHPRFELDKVVADLSRKKPTVFPGVPTMYTAIVNYPGVDKLDLSSLKFCASGGAPLPVEVQQKFERLTGCRLLEGWGMTETASAGCTTPFEGARKAGSCGIPLPGIVIKIVDTGDPAKEMPLGESGEICVKGPNVMKGYANSPEATAEALTPDGYLRTGDVGYMDEDGFLFIVDRTKDMILCSGYNVFPRTVEEAIYEHPSVAEVGVIGIPDEYRGQSPKAFVKLRDGAGTLALDELQAFLADKLGRHEMVQALEIRAELPKTLVGKIAKKVLYEEEEQRRQATG